MATYLVIADVHGNLPALEAVLGREKADGILALGDMIGELPDSKAVLQRLLEEKALCIRGNRERDMADFPRDWKDRLQFACLQAGAEQCGALLEQARAFPATVAHRGLRLSHGSPEHIRELLTPGSDRVAALMAACTEKILLSGHDHLQWSRRYRGKLAAAVGSVGLAHGNACCRADYALLCDGALHFRHVSYDPEALRRRVRQTHWLSHGPMALASVREALRGDSSIPDFVRFAYAFAARELGTAPDFIPNDLFAEAGKRYFNPLG